MCDRCFVGQPAPRVLRQSIEPTYDSRETGPRFHVTTRVDSKTIAFREPIADPFVRQTVWIGWRDLLRGLLRRHLAVEVIVGGDPEVVDDVMELDADTLTPNSTRRDEFAAHIADGLAGHVRKPGASPE